MTLSARIRTRISPLFQVDVAFEIAPGVTIVFGESGSGKTTVLRSVAGLATPDSGRITCGDRVLFDADGRVNVAPARRRIGFVFQHLALFPHLTAFDNITYGLADRPAAERTKRAHAIAESFRIAHLLDRRPAQISGGERQRVGLARALVTTPEALLLDEPLSALDYLTQSRIIADLREWNRERRIPILYVTHSQREVFALGERVLVLQAGSIAADGTPQQVMDAPSHDSVALLAGFENLLDAVVIERRPDAGVMVCRVTGTAVEIETPLADVGEGRGLRVAIRAGDVLIASERPHGLSARNQIPASIADLTHEGPLVRATASIGVPIEAHLTPTSSRELGLHPGLKVWLVIKTHACRPVSTI